MAGNSGKVLAALAGLVLAWSAPANLLAAPAAAPGHPQWPALTQLERTGAQVSAAAIDLDDMRAIDELHPDTHLTPASLTKLVTAAAALNRWPPDKLFHTRLLSSGPIIDGELRGDLVLLGAGDPSLDDQAFWNLAAQLRGAGVTRVKGRLLAIPAPFPAVGCETQDRCDALQHSDRSYNAPLGAIGVDFGNWCVQVRPGAAGAAAKVQGCAVNQLPINVEGTVRTVGPTAHQSFWVERVTDASGDHLHAGGDIAQGPAQQLYRSMSDPVRDCGLLLREMLRELGVQVTGGVETGAAPPATMQLLAQVEGLALGEQLGRMLRYSNNYIADVLTLDLAADAGGAAPSGLVGAAGVLSDFLATLEPAASPGPLLHSGSGLTPENLLSAHDLVGVLAHAYRDTRRFPTYYGGLVVPRDASFGFLREGSEAWLDRVALKTGSMDTPHSVLGIAGYLRKRNGGWIAFAAIVNGGEARAHIPLREALQAARADIEELLVRY
ncbi:MAG TPA: D-alanyl-D-alanine carboxypeptidase/D-alanyl-D-alanine-endopeptidase [Steroidobacteraceae bacterium]|nr:D-alanyl-D-alanine carboxypeptidase/D-alanyl-D-alanine-endopeptidase [Steroidobacteraceae bacterium]